MTNEKAGKLLRLREQITKAHGTKFSDDLPENTRAAIIRLEPTLTKSQLDYLNTILFSITYKGCK